jgi:hypothetical protein
MLIFKYKKFITIKITGSGQIQTNEFVGKKLGRLG